MGVCDCFECGKLLCEQIHANGRYLCQQCAEKEPLSDDELNELIEFKWTRCGDDIVKMRMLNELIKLRTINKARNQVFAELNQAFKKFNGGSDE
jgi:hypothetical protein